MKRIISIKCKAFGSYLYCYDKEKKEAFFYPKKKTALNDCPESVIEAFLSEDFDAEIIINHKQALLIEGKK